MEHVTWRIVSISELAPVVCLRCVRSGHSLRVVAGAVMVGLIPGTAELRDFELAGNPALGYTYVVGLSVVQLATGYLAVGLVRRGA